MEDYEIRDALRRATTPDLVVTLALARASEILIYERVNEVSKPVQLCVQVSNESNQPAFHVIVRVGLADGLALRTPGQFRQVGTRTDEQGLNFHWLERRISSPPELPLFKEADPWQEAFTFGVWSRDAASSEFYLITIVQTPGFEEKRVWALKARGSRITLHGPFVPSS